VAFARVSGITPFIIAVWTERSVDGAIAAFRPFILFLLGLTVDDEQLSKKGHHFLPPASAAVRHS
jgi:hypothetical protein